MTLRRLFLSCVFGGDGGGGGGDDMTIKCGRAEHTRSGCFRFADACPACPARMQMDTGRYLLRTVNAQEKNPACWLVPSFLPGAALTLVPGPLTLAQPNLPACQPCLPCLAQIHDVTGKGRRVISLR